MEVRRSHSEWDKQKLSLVVDQKRICSACFFEVHFTRTDDEVDISWANRPEASKFQRCVVRMPKGVAAANNALNPTPPPLRGSGAG